MTRKSFKSKKLVCGHGVKGDEITWENGTRSKSYRTWESMLRRCYSTKYQALQPTYIGCTVCDEWLYYPNFKSWFDKNYVEGWAMDKDLLVSGNKIYSPDNCIFAPQLINNLFTDCGRSRGEYPIGVCFDKETGKFRAHLAIDGKQKKLGRFNDPNEAHRVYIHNKKANVLRVADEWRDKISDKLYDALIRKADDLI